MPTELQLAFLVNEAGTGTGTGDGEVESPCQEEPFVICSSGNHNNPSQQQQQQQFAILYQGRLVKAFTAQSIRISPFCPLSGHQTLFKFIGPAYTAGDDSSSSSKEGNDHHSLHLWEKVVITCAVEEDGSKCNIMDFDRYDEHSSSTSTLTTNVYGQVVDDLQKSFDTLLERRSMLKVSIEDKMKQLLPASTRNQHNPQQLVIKSATVDAIFEPTMELLFNVHVVNKSLDKTLRNLCMQVSCRRNPSSSCVTRLRLINNNNNNCNDSNSHDNNNFNSPIILKPGASEILRGSVKLESLPLDILNSQHHFVKVWWRQQSDNEDGDNRLSSCQSPLNMDACISAFNIPTSTKHSPSYTPTPALHNSIIYTHQTRALPINRVLETSSPLYRNANKVSAQRHIANLLNVIQTSLGLFPCSLPASSSSTLSSSSYEKNKNNITHHCLLSIDKTVMVNVREMDPPLALSNSDSSSCSHITLADGKTLLGFRKQRNKNNNANTDQHHHRHHHHHQSVFSTIGDIQVSALDKARLAFVYKRIEKISATDT